MSSIVCRFGAIVVNLLLSFDLAFEESLRWPPLHVNLRTLPYTTEPVIDEPMKWTNIGIFLVVLGIGIPVSAKMIHPL